VAQVAAALAAGKHVVVDKPAAATAAEVRSLVDAAEAAGRMLTVFQNRRWDGDFATVRSLVDSGALGGVGRFESRFERSARGSRTAWKASTDPADLTDIVYDLGTHLVDQAQVLLGPAATVYAESRGPRDTTVLLTHAGGARSYLRMSDSTVPVAPRFAVTGTEAGFRTWGLDPQERASRDGVAPTEPGFGKSARPGVLVDRDGAATEVPLEDGDYLAYYRAVAACVEGRGAAPVPLADSVALAVTIDAAVRSVATGAPVVTGQEP
jgi:predicted dehydrogenase